MRLYCSPASPFVRKCRIVVREKGLERRVEEVFTDPYASEPDLIAANPIAQVPALVAHDGAVIIDSPIICAWLDEAGEGARLLPPSGPDHWRVRRVEALADAVLEVGVKQLLELRRPESERSPSWIERWKAGLGRALNALEAECPLSEAFDLGAIASVVAVTWLDFRHPSYDWKSGRPRLQALQAALEARDSFRATAPR